MALGYFNQYNVCCSTYLLVHFMIKFFFVATKNSMIQVYNIFIIHSLVDDYLEWFNSLSFVIGASVDEKVSL